MMQYRLYRAGVHEFTGTILECAEYVRERNPSIAMETIVDPLTRGDKFTTSTGLVYRIQSCTGLPAVSSKELSQDIASETSVLEWLACNDFEAIDDSQTSIYRHSLMDVYHDDGVWQVVVHTNTKARLIDYTMSFTSRTPAKTIITAIKSAFSDDISNR